MYYWVFCFAINGAFFFIWVAESHGIPAVLFFVFFFFVFFLLQDSTAAVEELGSKQETFPESVDDIWKREGKFSSSCIEMPGVFWRLFSVAVDYALLDISFCMEILCIQFSSLEMQLDAAPLHGVPTKIKYHLCLHGFS